MKKQFIIFDPKSAEEYFRVITETPKKEFVKKYKEIEKELDTYTTKFWKDPEWDFYKRVEKETKSKLIPFELDIIEIDYFRD